ncbi:MAG: hypothetical protein EZS28_055298, partial [Streblomastix strix]
GDGCGRNRLLCMKSSLALRRQKKSVLRVRFVCHRFPIFQMADSIDQQRIRGQRSKWQCLIIKEEE